MDSSTMSREDFLASMGISSDDLASPTHLKRRKTAFDTDDNNTASPFRRTESAPVVGLMSSSSLSPSATLNPSPSSKRKVDVPRLQKMPNPMYNNNMNTNSNVSPSSMSPLYPPPTSARSVNTTTNSIASNGPTPMSTPSASLYRSRGNKKFEERDFVSAIEWYSKALLLDKKDKLSLSNRSTAYLQGGAEEGHLGDDVDCLSNALTDAERCCEIDPRWYKGWSRKGDALYFMEKFDEALIAYKKAAMLCPSNRNVAKSVLKCSRKLS